MFTDKINKNINIFYSNFHWYPLTEYVSNDIRPKVPWSIGQMFSLKMVINKQISYNEYIISYVKVISNWKLDCGFDNYKCTPAATDCCCLYK